ncbi:hypothetical protein GCM10027590_01370 [Nocardiopsis nanhaiensis]
MVRAALGTAGMGTPVLFRFGVIDPSPTVSAAPFGARVSVAVPLEVLVGRDYREADSQSHSGNNPWVSVGGRERLDADHYRCFVRQPRPDLEPENGTPRRSR